MDFDIKEAITIFLKGLFMGSADIVPGVSGGTIALITGIYERLVHAISSINFTFIKPLLKGDFTGFKEKLFEEIDFELFIPLILGIGLAVLTLAHVISYLLEEQTAYTFSFFLGLILASSYILYTQLDEINIKILIVTAIGIVLSYIFVGLNPIAANHSLPVIFISGLIAICAMILPGNIHIRINRHLRNDPAWNFRLIPSAASRTIPVHAQYLECSKLCRHNYIPPRCRYWNSRILQDIELPA